MAEAFNLFLVFDAVFERSSNVSQEKWDENEGGNVREGKGSVGGGVSVNLDVEAIVYLKTKEIYDFIYLNLSNLFIRESGF